MADALEVLAKAPHSGRFHEESRMYLNTVVIRPKRWSYRIAYRVHGNVLVVHAVLHGWQT